MHAADVMAGSNSDEGTIFVLGYYNNSMNSSFYAHMLNQSLYTDGKNQPPAGFLKKLLRQYPPMPDGQKGSDENNLLLLAAVGSDQMVRSCSSRA